MGNLTETEKDKLQGGRKRQPPQQATAPAASDDAKIGRYSNRAQRRRHVELPRPDFLPDGRHGGTAAYPHALLHHAVGAPSAHVGGLVIVLHLSALFHRAVLRRLCPFHDLTQTGRHQRSPSCRAGSRSGSLLACSTSSTRTATASCSGRISSIKSTDFVVLSMPEVAGLPFVITGLVMAGGLAAALSTADGLLAHHRQRLLP